MTTGEYTPADPISGLPLLIVPDERVVPILHGEAPAADHGTGQVIADWNHVFHPAREVVHDGFGGDALRNARIQLVMRATHNAYHAAYYGPKLPANPTERFRATVLCAAGYIPLQALRFRRFGDPKVVDLRQPQIERLHTSQEVRVASFSVVQKFMKDFVMQQPVDHIRPDVIDDFLAIDPGQSPDDARRRRYLAHLLLSLVIDRTEDTLERPYSFARSYELLSPGLPTRPGDFVHSFIARSNSSARGITRELVKKFTAYRDGPRAAARLGGLAVLSQ
ncbi:MAG TPA: hypothetical protein VFT16_05055 [Candidatus Saccharimonadales bacterium]|nr:hypothetical protein [Candidatus Saccharimonadales bacterium]